MAATVWAARHDSNSPMHHSLSPLAAWKPHQCTSAWRHRLKPKCRNMFIKNQQGMTMTWNSIWLKYGQQPAELHWFDRSVTRLFYCVSQSQKQTLWTFAMSCFFMIGNCHDFLKLTLLLLWRNWLTFRFTIWVRTAITRGGQFCCSFVANLVKYMCDKN